MHRFATDYYNGPIAVNDLGWVSFDNPNYVLDLYGLGMYDAFRARVASGGSTKWVDDLTTKHNVRLAMVYTAWIKMPPTWREIATLNLLGSKVTPFDRTVAFFASPNADLPRIRAELVKFQTTLPSGAALQMSADPR
jgi:hypothetical protein